jgi:hypothetical protein
MHVPVKIGALSWGPCDRAEPDRRKVGLEVELAMRLSTPVRALDRAPASAASVPRIEAGLVASRRI